MFETVPQSVPQILAAQLSDSKDGTRDHLCPLFKFADLRPVHA